MTHPFLQWDADYVLGLSTMFLGVDRRLLEERCEYPALSFTEYSMNNVVGNVRPAIACLLLIILDTVQLLPFQRSRDIS